MQVSERMDKNVTVSICSECNTSFSNNCDPMEQGGKFHKITSHTSFNDNFHADHPLPHNPFRFVQWNIHRNMKR